MLLTGYAGQISLGHAGLLAAGAFTVGILFKEFNAPFWVTLPAAALVGALLGVVFGLPSLRLRGLYLAVSTLALHFVVVYLGGEYETKRGFSTGIVIDPPSSAATRSPIRASGISCCSPSRQLTLMLCLNLLRSRTGRAWGAIRAHETVAEALGISVAGYKLLAFVISSAMTAVAGALFAYYRGFVSVEAFSLFLSISYVAMIIIGGMGSLLGALLGAVFVTLFPYLIEAALLALPGAQRYAGDVRRELRRLRPGDGPVPGIRAARPRRHLAPHPELFPAVAVQAPAGCRSAPMTTLLAVDKLEVVYQRAITAVQGVTLQVAPGQIVALLGTNGAGKTTTLRAISGFLGLDDARVTEGTIAFKGERIENRPPHEITRRGIVLVPERDKVFPNLTVAENLAAPVAAAHAARAERRRAKRWSTSSSRGLPTCAAHRRPAVGRRAADARARERARVPARAAAGRRALARPRAGRGRGPARRLVDIRRELGISILLVEQNAAVALEIADYGYVMENGRIVLDGDAARLRRHADIQEFYLGQTGGERRSYRDVKQYRRSRRWYG